MKFKRQALNSINDMMLHGHSVRTASAALNLPHFYYKRWRKLVSSADRHISANAIVPSGITGETRKVHPGRLSQLAPFQGELLTSVFEMRQQGLPVNTRTLRKEAARVSDEFKLKSTKVHQLRTLSPQTQLDTHQCHSSSRRSTLTRRRPSYSTATPCQLRCPPSQAPKNCRIHLDAYRICVHCWTQ